MTALFGCTSSESVADVDAQVVHGGSVLPLIASEAFVVSDGISGVTLGVRIAKTRDVPAIVEGRWRRFRHAHPDGGDVLLHERDDGIEDFLVMSHRPTRPEARYELDLGEHVAGLRLVSRTLEMLDAEGTPRLRMAPPVIIDRTGARHPATVRVDGCSFSSDASAPWGRAVVAPGARRCSVLVSWSSAIRHPAVLDPSWTTTANMAEARSGHTATVLDDGRVLVAGGTTALSTELYDPATGTWAATGSLDETRSAHTATRLASGSVLIAGGFSDKSTTETYDPGSGMWTATASMGAGRESHTASLLQNGTVLVAGGFDFPPLATAELYDPSLDTWSPTGDMTEGRGKHTATVLLDGRVLVAGAANDSLFLDASTGVDIYDPGTGMWSSTDSMAVRRADHSATLLADGTVLVSGGRHGNGPTFETHGNAELWSPTTSMWSSTIAMASLRWHHSSSLLDDGTVLLAGGFNAGATGPNFSTEIYDPTAGSFTPSATLNTRRVSHTASRLPDGRILVSGGSDGTALTEAELYAGALQQGIVCADATECASGFCVDGVCCDSACGDDTPDDCQACAMAAGASADGVCTTLADGMSCNDGDLCTLTDACSSGVCGGMPVVCAASDACHLAGACDPLTGACTDPPSPDGTSCDDGDACSQDDRCQAGTCVGADPIRCEAIDECHETGTCEPATGACSNPVSDDGTPCSTGLCEAGMCVPEDQISSPTTSDDTSDDGSCTCSTPGDVPSDEGGWWLLAFAAGFAGRRRRQLCGSD